MRDLIKKNKRKSWLLMSLFVVIIGFILWFGSYLTSDPATVFILGSLVGLFYVFISYFAGDKMILASVGAKEVDKEVDAELYRIVENLAITAGIPTPQVYLIPDNALNAFATGRDPEHAAVAITQGLRNILTKSELEAVMGHEMSHIKHYDIRVLLLTTVLVGVIVFLADFLWRVSFYGRSEKRSPLILIPALILGLIVAPLGAQLIKLAVSRSREFLADAGSALLTRYPESMISALEKISQAPTIAGHHDSIAHLFIYPPAKKSGFMQKLFSTHPPILERIEALRKGARIKY